jgi:UDP-galactopyranose mutase
MVYDYLIVGSGFFGSICAYELRKANKTVLVIDSRNHIGGNCYTEKRDDINIHVYGPHIFHTSNEKVWLWINQFAKFNNFRLSPVAQYKNELYSLPFSMWTFNKMWGVTTPEQARQVIESQSADINEPTNFEEQAIKLVGLDVYNKLIKGYSTKQWMKDPRELPKEIITRLPVRFTYDSNYFNDKYQGIPEGGYTQIFEKLLDKVEVNLNTDYFKDELPKHRKVIYTGPIDKFFNYKFGELEYKTTKFEHRHIPMENYQGTAVMHFTEREIKQTRIIEHKHFENTKSNSTWVSWEYPTVYKAELTEPFYPVNDKKNNAIFLKYKEEANLIKKDILFGGRLAEYKYYDMHQVIESALNFITKELTQ